MSRIHFLIALLFVFSCKEKISTKAMPVINIDNPKDLVVDTDTTDFREFRVLDSQYLRKDEIWKDFNVELADFTEVIYNELKPIVLEQDIMTLQSSIADGELSYEALTKFYMYRIRKFDRENDLSLNSVISLNPYVLQEARERDKAIKKKENRHLIYGMPILLKDNVNVANMPTTAGAAAFHNNYTDDAFITTQLRKKGALILGKSNLSEWAYFFCGDCPSGYSAMGGQTLNPYGRRVFDTGGSSSGSGVSVSANFAAATLGSETSGSILSPASQNSAVGLKPTIGLVSRSGIVPISSTLDTAGPITRTVMDNAIVLDAIFGEDKSDFKSIYALWDPGFYTNDIKKASLEGKRFGAPKRLLEDTLYLNALAVLKNKGAEIVEIDEEKLGLPNFLRLWESP